MKMRSCNFCHTNTKNPGNNLGIFCLITGRPKLNGYLLVTLFTHPCASPAGQAGLLGDMVSPFRQRGWSLDETVKLGH